MANILTADEGGHAIRTDPDDPVMLDLLPVVDSYIQNATGRDWSQDDSINNTAKAAARMLLVLMYDNPDMIGVGETSLSQGITACLSQLEAIALQYRTFAGRNGAGPVTLKYVEAGDTVSTLVGIIGATGDQSTAFEDVISINDQIQQISTGDLSANYYRAFIIPPGLL